MRVTVDRSSALIVNHEEDTVGRRIRAARWKRDLTQIELAGNTGVAHPTISKIETSRATPHRATVTALAAGLGVTAESLLVGYEPLPGAELN